MPIALGYGARGEARRPWALWWSVVGGLLFSQLVTLSLTPGVLHLHVGRAGKVRSWRGGVKLPYPAPVAG